MPLSCALKSGFTCKCCGYVYFTTIKNRTRKKNKETGREGREEKSKKKNERKEGRREREEGKRKAKERKEKENNPLVKAPQPHTQLWLPQLLGAASASGSRAAQPPGPLPQDALTLLPGTYRNPGRKSPSGPTELWEFSFCTQDTGCLGVLPGARLCPLAELMQRLVLGAGVGWILLVPATRVPSFSFLL